jgi:hypothetical protein
MHVTLHNSEHWNYILAMTTLQRHLATNKSSTHDRKQAQEVWENRSEQQHRVVAMYREQR